MAPDISQAAAAIQRPRLLLLKRSPCLLLLSVILLCFPSSTASSSPSSSLKTIDRPLKFLFINGGSAFFEPVAQGFVKRCLDLGIEMHYAGPVFGSINETLSNTPSAVVIPHPEECHDKQHVIRQAIANGVDGIIAKPACNNTFLGDLIEEAHQANIPFVLFDGDIPTSKRSAYVGTDNVFLGATMARLLRQLRPEGGTFAVLGRKKGRTDGFLQEITKDNHRDNRAHWYEVGSDLVVNETLFATENDKWWFEMSQKAKLHPTAMVAMVQSPMRHPNWTDFIDDWIRPQDITMIGVDGADYQLDYLNRRYVDGLVGQLPYEMGMRSTDVLYDIVQNNGQVQDEIVTTNVVAYNLIPVELPPLELEQNLLGDLKYIGWICFVVVAVTAILCIIWTIRYRNTHVVRMSQPFFLLMVAVGVLIMAATLIPLSYDDDGPDSQSDNLFLQVGDSEDISDLDEKMEDVSSLVDEVAICMSIPWLAFTGFTVTFAALFSKTWRVNQLLRNRQSHARMHVRVTDVLAPFVILMVCNVVVLVIWTIHDPLTYVRQFKSGTDFWNREIESYGACRSDNAVAYLAPLILFNLSVLAITCWQALEARAISSPLFSEAKSIMLSLGSILQTFLTGVPVVAVVRNMPVAFYLVLTFVIFVLSMVILGFIFVPKINLRRQFAAMSESEQRKVIAASIRQHVQDSSPVMRESGMNGSSLGIISPFDASGSFRLEQHRVGAQERPQPQRQDQEQQQHQDPRTRMETLSSANATAASGEMHIIHEGMDDCGNEDGVNYSVGNSIPPFDQGTEVDVSSNDEARLEEESNNPLQ